VPLIVFFRPGDPFPNDTEGRATGWTLLTESTSVRPDEQV
jgi:hypothetical protein